MGQKWNLPRGHLTAGWKQTQSTVLTGLLKKQTSRQRAAGGRTPRALQCSVYLPSWVYHATAQLRSGPRSSHSSLRHLQTGYCRGYSRRLCQKLTHSPSGAEGGSGIIEGHELRTKCLGIRVVEAILAPYSSPGPIQGDD